MTKVERLARMEVIHQRVGELARHRSLTSAQQEEYERLDAEFYQLDRDNKLDEVRSVMNSPFAKEEIAGVGNRGESKSPQANFRGDPWSDEIRSFGENPTNLRGRALTAIEKVAHTDDAGRQRITKAIEASEDLVEVDILTRWAITTSDPHYLTAFYKRAQYGEDARDVFTGEEREAWRRAKNLQRAMSLTDSAGGYLVPFQLDPAVILANSGYTHPLRRIARTVVATGDVWNGVTGTGTAAWTPEGTEVADNSPTFTQPTVQIHKLASFVPISIEAYEDAKNVTAEVTKILVDAMTNKEAEAFITGSGSNEPVGIVTALTGGSSEVNQTGTTLDYADFTATQEALPARYQPNASWIMHLVSMNRARAVTAGATITTAALVEGNPPSLLGRPVYEANYMDSSVTGSASDYLAVYGDFQHYVIADRIGMTVEFIPHLVGANRRPTGQRGWYAYKRTGADSVLDAAFRMLDKSA